MFCAISRTFFSIESALRKSKNFAVISLIDSSMIEDFVSAFNPTVSIGEPRELHGYRKNCPAAVAHRNCDRMINSIIRIIM